MRVYFTIVLCLSILIMDVESGRNKRPPVIENAIANGATPSLLTPGITYPIESPNYPENYYGRTRNFYLFDVDPFCTEPQVQCDVFELFVNWRCSDRIVIFASERPFRSKFCAWDDWILNEGYSVPGSPRYFDIMFKTNRRGNARGFSCVVSCGDVTTVEPPATSVEPPATSVEPPATSVEPPATTAEPPNTNSPSTNCKCGVPNRSGTKIIGGIPTEKNEYPWQVVVKVRGSFTCGGSLISKRTVLTAAHCTYGTAEETTVVVGEHNLYSNDGQQTKDVETIIDHENYNEITIDYDYALLILTEDVTWSDDVKPICLPSNSDALYANDWATIKGWGNTGSGYPNILNEANVTTMPNAECSNAYGSSITARMICAAYPGKDSCQGDSGGPMIARDSDGSTNYYSQIGVVSWGNGCALPNYPGVYSRVTAVQEWIEDEMEGDTCGRPSTSG